MRKYLPPVSLSTALFAAITMMAWAPASAWGAVTVGREGGGVVLKNGSVQVSVAADGAVSAGAVRDDKLLPMLSSGRSAPMRDGRELLAGAKPTLSVKDVTDGIGAGKAAELTYAIQGAQVRAVYVVYDQGEFFTSEVFITASGGAFATNSIRVLAGQLSLGEGEIRAVTHDKQWEATVRVLQDNNSDFFAALYNRQAKVGAVLGALTPEAESKIRCKAGSAVEFEMLAVYAGPGAGELRVAPGKTARSGAYIVALPGNIFEGLEGYGLAARKYNDIKLYRPIPCGWCSWDAYDNGVTERNILDSVDTIKKLRLTEYGFNVLQIDDGWQRGWRRSGDWQPVPTRFPNGIKPLTAAANAVGVTLGLWIGPFTDEDSVDKSKRNYAPMSHPEFSSRNNRGQPSGQYDLSMPEFKQFLGETMKEFTQDWGARYVKADFLAWNYSVEKDKSLPHHDIYRNALKAMRAGMAPDTYFMTCISHEWKCIGIADSQRIGGDVKSNWNGINPTIRCAGPLYFTNGNLWWGDPDQLHVGGSVDKEGKQRGLTMDQARAWAAMIALYGSVTLTGDRMTELSPERMRLFTQCMPSTGLTARPIDLFDVLTNRSPERHSSLWALKVAKPFGDYHVLGLFNWTTSGSQTRNVNLADLGFKPADSAVVYDYWQEKLLPVVKGDGVLTVDVPSSSCQLLAVHKLTGQPAFLSSDRHLTAGAVDVTDARFDANTSTLSGASTALVKGVEFRYAVYVPTGRKIQSATFDGQPANVTMAGENLAILRFTPSKPAIQWNVKF